MRSVVVNSSRTGSTTTAFLLHTLLRVLRIPVPNLVLLAAVVSCTGANSTDMPAPIGADAGGSDADAPPMPSAQSNLSLWLEPRQAPPLAPPGLFVAQVATIALEFEDVRVIGDSAIGADGTRIVSANAIWDQVDARAVLTFTSPPPGRYSAFKAELTGCMLTGTVTVDEELFPFELKLDNIGELAVPLAANLPAGGGFTTAIRVDAETWLRDADWDNADENNGVLEFEDDSPEFLALPGRIINSFANADVADVDSAESMP